MQWTSLVALLVVGAAAHAAAEGVNPNGTPVYDLRKTATYFTQFVKEYNRVYKSLEDMEVHYEAFKKNLLNINRENAASVGPGAATFAINKFADYTDEEMEKMNGFKPSKQK